MKRPGSDIPRALGAYAARSCPAKTQWDVLRPVDPEPPSAFFAGLAADGLAYEECTYDLLASLHLRAVRVAPDGSGEEREAATSAAIDAGAPVVLGGRLPTDHVGCRVAQPDLLIRVATEREDGRWRYAPVDVKHHRVMTEEGAPVVVQDLADAAVPDTGHEVSAVGRRSATIKGDLIQLAHYWRTLEAARLAPSGRPWAGVLGSEGQIVWYRLDDPLWRHTDRSGVRLELSTLSVYDLEFAQRLAIATAAVAHRSDPEQPLLVEPVRIAECSECKWRTHCGQILNDRQDVSLLPGVNLKEWRALGSVGAATIPKLAGLETDMGVQGVSDDVLARLVDEARAWLGPDPAYRRHGVPQIVVPHADIELDVDMENAADGAYLWGVWVTDRARTGLVEEGYLKFVDWDPDASIAGPAAFEAFWYWLQALQARCAAAGVSIAAYCWSAGAENRWLREGGTALGVKDEVEQFVQSTSWVDLLRVFQDQVVTGQGGSLKIVAPLTGFSWRDDDPGGAQSMQWWADAVDLNLPDAERASNRTRLLRYNEDDVRATRHIRDWLDVHGPGLTSTGV